MSFDVERLPGVAVVGLACRPPGARDYREFWDNLVAGVESVEHHSVEDMIAAGEVPDYAGDPDYVRATGVTPEIDALDAGLFRITPREAEIRDPQHRLFLECTYSALNDAGYDPARLRGPVGVFAGGAPNVYEEHYVRKNPGVVNSVGDINISVSNDSDYVATFTSFKLGFTGPSVSIATACSTALVAIHMACQSLRSGECAVAVAGGVQMQLDPHRGYWFEEGSILSRGGHVRPFDAGADGTIFTSGGGAVVLKRLDDAVRDGDHVYAVVRGSWVNNDGSARAGFTAPGVDGQAELIAMALDAAGVSAESIGFVEAHGTGTAVGDPIEVKALTQAFRAQTAKAGYCAIGSVKGNVGHLGPAAGVAGFINAVLALDRQLIPPSINFEQPNPAIPLAETPFALHTVARPWPRSDRERRAGVSSFGIGGTNAHVIVEEAPSLNGSDPASRPYHLFPVSARSDTAVSAACEQLAAHLEDHPELDPADVATTLQTGRGVFDHRHFVVAPDVAAAATTLRENAPRALRGRSKATSARVAFLFPGQGAQYPGMGADLYEREPVYRDAIDRCAELLRDDLGRDVRALLHATDDPDAEEALRQTEVAQPAIFAVEWALAELWSSLAIEPVAMLGHSIGELVAATRAGVFSLEDGLRTVAARGRLMQECLPGAMLALPLGREEVAALTNGSVAIAASNSPQSCVVSGPADAIEAVREQLGATGVEGRLLVTSHAFHSALVEPAMGPFAQVVGQVERRPPAIPYLSNLTGDWVTAEQACDPQYWAAHLRSEVRFSAALSTLVADRDTLLLEVGPGQVLTTFARQHVADADGNPCVQSMRHPHQKVDDQAFLLAALGGVWAGGVNVDWGALRNGERRRRVPLPGYPYERQRHWVDPAPDAGRAPEPAADTSARTPLEAPFSVPVWTERPARARPRPAGEVWLFLIEEDDALGAALVSEAEAAGVSAVVATAGHVYNEELDSFSFDPDAPDDYPLLLDALADTGRWPDRIVHALCPPAGASDGRADTDRIQAEVDRGFMSLLFLLQAFARRGNDDGTRLIVVTNGMQRVLGTETVSPGQASVLGPVMTVGKEIPHVDARSVDVDLEGSPDADIARVARAVVAEAGLDDADQQVALRAGRRWVLGHAEVAQELDAPSALRSGGVYLITGGLGGLGLEIAHDFAREAGARLVLVGRRRLPPRDEWASAIAAGDTHAPTLERLLAIEADGGEVMVCSADVTDADALRLLVAEVRAKYGTLHGVVHAAGLPGGGMIAVRKAEDAQAVFESKTVGTLALMEACGEDLDFFAGFSSILSVAAEFGQVDYSAANAVLDRMLTRRADSPGYFVAINWPGWTRVGMLGEAAQTIGAGTGTTFLSHPLLRTLTRIDDDHIVCTLRFEPGRQWMIDEHRFDEDPVAPATLCLELIRAAYAAATEVETVEIADAFFTGALILSEPTDCEIELQRDEDDWWRVSFVEKRSDADQVRAVARVRGVDLPDPSPIDLAPVRARVTIPAEPQRIEMFYGAHWQSVQSALRDETASTILVDLELPAGLDADAGDFWLHPALLDRATAMATPGVDQTQGYLPFGYRRLVVHRPIPARCVAVRRHRFDPSSVEWTDCDVTVVDEEGNVCVEIEGYSLRISTGEDDPGPGDDAAAASSGVQTAVERYFNEEAIDPEEGVVLFRRILAARHGPQVIVCPEGVKQRFAWAESAGFEVLLEDWATTGPAPVSGERPLATPLVAPETELEALLASLWSEALGIDELGVEDDFFDLGGSSLVAVQLLSRIRDRLNLEVPIATVFETATVRQLAARIEQQLVELVAALPDEAVRQGLESAR